MKTITTLEIYKLALYRLLAILESEKLKMENGSIISIQRFEKLNDQALELSLAIIGMEAKK